jgi:hypothetical protein
MSFDITFHPPSSLLSIEVRTARPCHPGADRRFGPSAWTSSRALLSHEHHAGDQCWLMRQSHCIRGVSGVYRVFVSPYHCLLSHRLRGVSSSVSSAGGRLDDRNYANSGVFWPSRLLTRLLAGPVSLRHTVSDLEGLGYSERRRSFSRTALPFYGNSLTLPKLSMTTETSFPPLTAL